MEEFPPPDLYELYSDTDLRLKVEQLQARERLLTDLIEATRGEIGELLGIQLLRESPE